jgi:hypothetical protein
LLNVHYVLSDRDLAGPGLELVYEEGAVQVYRLGDPLPRAWLVQGTQVADDGRALALLDDETFDPRAEAVLAPAFADLALSGPPGAGGVARIVAARPGRLALDVSAVAPGLLVVSQPFYPGWRAKVDGQAVPLARVDYLLQGVPVPAGDHRVELVYRLSPWPAIFSGLALVGGLAVLIVRRSV